MDARTQRAFVAASVAGLLTAAGLSVVGQQAQAQEGDAAGGTVHCYGINKCMGTGDCGGKGHSCAGKNACQGQGYLDVAEKNCLRIQGGRLTPEPEEG